MNRSDGHRLALVLAGGNGALLASMTTDASGVVAPKQCCSLAGGRSMLSDTLARAQMLVDPERTVVVVAREHEPFWSRQLPPYAPPHVVVQPQNRGVASGVLMPLLKILSLDPEAQVTLLPSDRFVADQSMLARTICAPQYAPAMEPSRVVLVGIVPHSPDPDYDWLLPILGSGRTQHIRSFIENPGVARASALMRAGAVWNSFLIVDFSSALLCSISTNDECRRAWRRSWRLSHIPARTSPRRCIVAWSRPTSRATPSCKEPSHSSACTWHQPAAGPNLDRLISPALHGPLLETERNFSLQQCTGSGIHVLGERVTVRIVAPCCLLLMRRNRRDPRSVPAP